MLVLSRHKEESIVIAGNIVVTVLSIRGDVVRLGVTAPPEVTINRHEIEDAIIRERDRSGGK
jgi:carbon storage regulator